MHSNDILLTQEGHAGALSQLLTQGADPSLTDKTGKTGEYVCILFVISSHLGGTTIIHWWYHYTLAVSLCIGGGGIPTSCVTKDGHSYRAAGAVLL
jgi:hypothetical protein